MPDDELREQLPQALQIVWMMTGLISGLIVIAPLLVPSEFLLHLFPVCAAKAAGRSCILCGMTTAFVQIGAGNFAGAQVANRGALALYSGLALNFGGLAAYTIWRVKRHANT